MRPDGGDPDRDDYGLPHVDVVVPDDARELERDVLAYRREVRRRRLRARLRGALGPFGRFGLVPPVVSLVLLLVLAGGTVLTVLTPRTVPRPAPTSMPRAPTAAPGAVGGPLPATRVMAGGRSRPLADAAPGVIMIVPPACRCEALVTELARQTRGLNLKFWLAADRRRTGGPGDRTAEELRGLAADAPAGQVTVLDDTRNVLAGTYRRVASGTAPTALLVHTDAVVGGVIDPVTGPVPTDRLRPLAHPHEPA